MGKHKKAFKDMSWQQKREMTLTVGNKDYVAWKYIDMLAAKLPPVIDKNTGKPHDHKKFLNMFYQKKGVEGIQEYSNMINEVVTETLQTKSEELQELIKANDNNTNQQEQRNRTGGEEASSQGGGDSRSEDLPISEGDGDNAEVHNRVGIPEQRDGQNSEGGEGETESLHNPD